MNRTSNDKLTVLHFVVHVFCKECRSHLHTPGHAWSHLVTPGQLVNDVDMLYETVSRWKPSEVLWYFRSEVFPLHRWSGLCGDWTEIVPALELPVDAFFCPVELDSGLFCSVCLCRSEHDAHRDFGSRWIQWFLCGENEIWPNYKMFSAGLTSTGSCSQLSFACWDVDEQSQSLNGGLDRLLYVFFLLSRSASETSANERGEPCRLVYWCILVC